jgi:hypothetical protein
MPVTTRVAPVEVQATPYPQKFNSAKLLRTSCRSLVKDEDKILDSSFGDGAHIQCAHNGFVCAVLDAYLQHRHLVIRPDDVWFAILTQFSFYVNRNAEKLRDHFVNHRGKRRLQIRQDHFDFEQFFNGMTDLIADNVKDPALREWIMPSFSTTTDSDQVTAAIIMMGTMQKYFAYFCNICCGLPSVTLLGEKGDWEDILERVQSLSKFGEEHEDLQIWNSLLSAVVTNFIRTFDAPDSERVVKFWQRTVHQFVDDYSGDKLITGWVQAFCFWAPDGSPLVARSIRYTTKDWRTLIKEHGLDYWIYEARIGELEWANIPAGYVHAPIHMKIDGFKFMAKAIAGSIGWTVRDSGAIFLETRGVHSKPTPFLKKKVSNLNLYRVHKAKQPSTLTGKTLVALQSVQEKVTVSSKVHTKKGAAFFQKLIRKIPCLTFLDKRDDDSESQMPMKKISPEPPRLDFEYQSDGIPIVRTLNSPIDPPKEILPEPEPKQKHASPTIISKDPLRSPAFQISDLSELARPWEYEEGGMRDAIQPVTGWWLVQTNEGTYGKDADAPDVQLDSDADDYDDELATRGRPRHR